MHISTELTTRGNMKIHLSEIDISTWIYENRVRKKNQNFSQLPLSQLINSVVCFGILCNCFVQKWLQTEFLSLFPPITPCSRRARYLKTTGDESGTRRTHDKKVVYHTCARKAVEECLNPTQFAYRQGGNCTNALISVQHHVYKYLDNQDCKAVRIFTIDFSNCIRFS